VNRHIKIVSAEFRIVGFLLGLASLMALADFGYTAFLMHNMPPADNSPPLAISKYGLVGQVAGRAVHTLSFAAAWVLTAMTVVAFVLLLLAVLIYVTGSGISRQTGWARVIGALLSLILAFITISAITVIDRNAIPIMAVPAALSLYTLWALVWQYG
jgi:hypothetical protein